MCTQRVFNVITRSQVQVSSLALPLSHRRCSTPDRAKLHLCTCNRLILKDETHFNVAKTGLDRARFCGRTSTAAARDSQPLLPVYMQLALDTSWLRA
uniref:Uncharacterized protein n=1 Tax=Trichogramma kaykai TaxID=54128 RepID=A0ABD2X4F4_9HYME